MRKLYWHEGIRRARFAAAALAIASFGAKAQDLEPRTYANAPVGLNFLIAGYGYTAGGVATDPAVSIDDAHVEVHSTVLAYARSLGVFGKSAKFNVVLPYAWVSGSAKALGQFREREVSGFADPRFQMSVNFFGAPALSLDDFAHYRQDTIVGASLSVTAPGGQYDSDKLLSIGTNRWSIKPEIGISKRLGPVTLEVAGGVRFYTDNDDFFGGRVREQDPIYSVQGHLIYSFGYGIWGAVDGTYYTGGRTTVDGRKDDKGQENSRLGVTLALPVNRYNSVKLYFSTGISARTGTDFDAAGIVWQYRFGGGL
ncbi:MAG: transporter [Candidatus Binatia bacterium]